MTAISKTKLRLRPSASILTPARSACPLLGLLDGRHQRDEEKRRLKAIQDSRDQLETVIQPLRLWSDLSVSGQYYFH